MARRPASDLRERLDDLAASFKEKKKEEPGYWSSVQELFTRGVTEKGLRDLWAQETQETFQYFTREIDFAELKPRPWYKRYPHAAWRVFLATAYRLSPERRILFALSVPMLAFGWGYFLLRAMAARSMTAANILGWESTLMAGTLLLLLLALELRDKLTLKGDLEVARQIQFGLLPFEPIEREDMAVAALMRPANTVGGDYFDVIDLPDGQIAVVVADVAGKGMPAALLMALLQGSLRTLLTAGFRGADLVATLNDHLCANIPSNRLITLFYGEYDPADGRLRYVNAGHNAPFLQGGDGQGDAPRLHATGMALGVMPGTLFEAQEARLCCGDRLVLYTDGVTEATNPGDEEYGELRLASFLCAGRGRGHRELVEGVREEVLAFCGSVRPRDDMTLLVLARPTA
jgi:sigma-B regulation protein RsbU (phosphoserine phosphatase)